MSNGNRCDGVSRREFVRVGGLSAFGLGLGSFFGLERAGAMNATRSPKAKACILIWLDGGPSHLETFDPKPDAPAEVRGPLAAIDTNISGIRISECLERTAQVMDKLAVVRSVTSPLGEHSFGTQYLLTGYQPTPALEYPSLGSTVSQLVGQQGVLPPFVSALNPDIGRGTSIGSGYLPRETAPFIVGNNLKVDDIDLYQGLDLRRIDRRRQIVNAFDNFSRARDAGFPGDDPDLERAYRLLSSTEAKLAFDLTEEPVSLRQKYGDTGGADIGRGCLLARRLVERGVPFVTVNSAGWDTHVNLLQLKSRYPTDTQAHLPSLDRALSALITDLSDRGMLDETLVVVMGEFGRTPKINAQSGRDHWPNVFSVAFAGGGVQGGQVVGSSDALGEFPKDTPVTPSDLAATIFALLGIDPAHELHTGDGRPVRVVPDGSRVISELMG